MAYRYKRRRFSSGRRRYSRSKHYRKGDSTVRSIAYALGKYSRIKKAQAQWAALRPALTENTPLWTRKGTDGNSVNVSLDDYIAYRAASGRGSYGLGSLGRRAGSAIGGRLGSRKAGAAIGGFLGNAAGSYLGVGGYTAAGLGDYDLDEGPVTNSLINGSSMSVPRMMGGNEIGSIVVTHKEYLGNITGSQNFENSYFSINPGLVSVFPWLSQIAQNYTEYSFNQLMFTYTSLLSEATNAGVVGQIIMTTNYNAADPPFTSTSDMLNNVGTVSARPIDGPVIHGVECDDTKNVLPSYYVRNGSVPPGEDKKTYDVGTFELATEGMPSSNTVQGQLWVSYSVELRKPKIYTAAGKGIQCDMFKNQSTIFTLAKMTSATLLACNENNIGTVITCPADKKVRVNFPSTVVLGFYRIRFQWMVPT